MGVAFTSGQELARGDLDIFLTNSQGNAANAYAIHYAIYYVDPVSGFEVLIGSDKRVPLNPSVGEYYASLRIPDSADAGTYRVRWDFREVAGAPLQQVVQEWAIVSPNNFLTTNSPYSPSELDMIRRLRIMLRDQNPDKFYRFRPPEREKDVSKYNQVFGYIWEDAELHEYLQAGLDWWNMFPPETEALNTLNTLVAKKPAWRTVVMWAAIVHAATALQFLWTSEEFSYSIGGINLDLEKSSKYQSLRDGAQQQFDKATESKQITTKIMRGLQQSKFNQGLKTAFGPKVGKGVLAPASFFA
jgi:hypothetical protein